MISQEIIDKVESSDLETRLGLASTLTSFVRILRNQPEWNSLRLALTMSRERLALLDYLKTIALRPVDKKYENPWDTAMAVYMLALNDIDPHLASVAFTSLKSAGNTFWAERVGELIKSPEVSVTSGITSQNTGQVNRSNLALSSEAVQFFKDGPINELFRSVFRYAATISTTLVTDEVSTRNEFLSYEGSTPSHLKNNAELSSTLKAAA